MKEMENVQKDATGPLRLTMPTNPALASRVARKRLIDRLRGHSTSSAWLPDGLSPELDELREQQLDLRDQVAAEIKALAALDVKYAAEDEAWRVALTASYRPGASEQPDGDTRTPGESRGAERLATEERLWAAAEALAEVCDEIIATFRRQEPELLGAQREKDVKAQEEIRKAEAILAAARTEQYRAERIGAWIQMQADDEGIMGRQPHPGEQRAPRTYVRNEDAYKRPWHQRRAWANKTEEVAA